MAKRNTNDSSTALSNSIKGKVASIGPTGSLITDISNDSVAGLVGDDSVCVKFGAHETLGIFNADHGEPDATLVATTGHNGSVEIEIVGVSLSDMLGIREGVDVEIAW